jgi:hypothetical protein
MTYMTYMSGGGGGDGYQFTVRHHMGSSSVHMLRTAVRCGACVQLVDWIL